MTTDLDVRVPLALTRAAASGWSAAARRTLDVVVACTVLLVLAPILLVVALLIRIESPGSSIFRQGRVGLGETPFTIYKFRTMYSGADPEPHRKYVVGLLTGQANAHATGPQSPALYKLVHDDRITRVGRVLRRTSLDEVPQLFNVVRGQMTLVGPRPAMRYEVEHYADWQRARFSVKPGVTGLWQVSGRNRRTFEEMVRLDVEYVERRSLWLDVAILARTPWAVLTGRGAV